MTITSGHAVARQGRAPGAITAFVLFIALFAFAPFAAPTAAVQPVPTAPQGADYIRREVDVPARDGVLLRTTLLIPTGAKALPILLNRTPFATGARLKKDAARLVDVLPGGYKELAASGYIFAFQDVRGKGGSGGEYVVTRPLIGPYNRTRTDHATDAWDTIDWLVRNTPESNGRVGMIGSSYEGLMVLMALTDPHPALKAAAPIEPMVDPWKGDDWFHNGAFRQPTMTFAMYFDGPVQKGAAWPEGEADDYAALLKAGSAGAYARAAGLEASPFWKMVTGHPAYDDFWQSQALDRRLTKTPLKVATLHVGSLWDQEDIYGAVHAYRAMEAKDRGNDRNFLVLGPWRHSQWKGDGSGIGPLKWDHDTVARFRGDILRPFLDGQLKDGAAAARLAPVTAFETGTGIWRTYDAWPRSCAKGCAGRTRPLYLRAGGALSFEAPAAGEGAADSYVSDPAKPVPYSPRPNKVVTELGENWPVWLTEDQRAVSDSPDVLTYVTEPLTQPVRIAGSPVANIFAATTGEDSDWVVKLIDVYPDAGGEKPMAGYQLPVAMDILRGRYRTDPAKPKRVKPGKTELYRFALPTANHVFRPGHRIMVQIQSSWFPLYDRNPQTFVDNIFFAKPEDYRAATQTVFHAPGKTSFVELPTVAP